MTSNLWALLFCLSLTFRAFCASPIEVLDYSLEEVASPNPIDRFRIIGRARQGLELRGLVNFSINGPAAYLEGLFVPKHRRLGIGSHLFEMVLKECRRRDVRTISMIVSPQEMSPDLSDLITFYTKIAGRLGFAGQIIPLCPNTAEITIWPISEQEV